MRLSSDIPFWKPVDMAGDIRDLRTLREDKWLMDSEVKYLLSRRKGLWFLTMIYISIHDPFKLLCKKIDSYPSEKKAKIFAEILQRGIRKDARGTLKTNHNAFHICQN